MDEPIRPGSFACPTVPVGIALGADPIDARKAIAEPGGTLTVYEAFEKYVEGQEPGWRHSKTPKRWRATFLTYVSPNIGERDIASVTVDDIHGVLAPIWATKTETASKLRGRLEAVLDWAKVKGYRDGANPAIWRGNLKHMLSPRRKVSTVTHHPALPWQDIPAFMGELRSRSALAAPALELTILCATRTGETLLADRNEIVGDLWIIPASRMKNERQHYPSCPPRG
jgi:integrase